jgi:hypothetical protein
MKKTALILIICLAAIAGFSQSNVSSKKFVSNATVTTDTSFTIQSSAMLNNYTWQLWASWTGSVLAGVPYLKIQVSPDNVLWLNYSRLDSAAVTAAAQSVAWEDDILPANYMRVYITVPTGDTLKALNIWYTLKK